MNESTQCDNVKQAQPLDGCNVAREKYWTELSIEEKIERTRGIVRSILVSLSEENDRLRRRVDTLEKRFNCHSHFEAEVVIPLSAAGSFSNTIGETSFRSKTTNQDYF